MGRRTKRVYRKALAILSCVTVPFCIASSYFLIPIAGVPVGGLQLVLVSFVAGLVVGIAFPAAMLLWFFIFYAPDRYELGELLQPHERDDP